MGGRKRESPCEEKGRRRTELGKNLIFRKFSIEKNVLNN